MGDLTGLTICVGYVIPISCCATGLCMSGYGCYRYYISRQTRQEQLRLNRLASFIITEQPKVKKDTLKNQIVSDFFKKRQTANLSLEEVHKPYSFINDSCSICLDEYCRNGEDSSDVFIGYVKKCGHYFHFECLWEWLEIQRSCPICREECQIDITDILGVSLKQIVELSDVYTQLIDGNDQLTIQSENVPSKKVEPIEELNVNSLTPVISSIAVNEKRNSGTQTGECASTSSKTGRFEIKSCTKNGSMRVTIHRDSKTLEPEPSRDINVVISSKSRAMNDTANHTASADVQTDARDLPTVHGEYCNPSLNISS